MLYNVLTVTFKPLKTTNTVPHLLRKIIKLISGDGKKGGAAKGSPGGGGKGGGGSKSPATGYGAPSGR